MSVNGPILLMMQLQKYCDSCSHALHSRSASDFRCFVSGIVAAGGGDGPEDIMGGLNAVFTHLYWRQDSTKVEFYILQHIQICITKATLSIT